MTRIFCRSIIGKKRTPAAGVVGLSWILIAGAVVAFAYVAWVAGERSHFQRNELRKLESKNVVSEIHPRSAPLIHAAAPQLGSVLGRIQIQQLGLEAIVVEGDSPGVLQRAVGHVPKTRLPGQFGNVVLAGHRDSFFRSLRLIRPHDIITFSTPNRDFQYEVESTAVVASNAVSVLQPSARSQLTLITCYPFKYIGPAPYRFVVVARQIA